MITLLPHRAAIRGRLAGIAPGWPSAFVRGAHSDFSPEWQRFEPDSGSRDLPGGQGGGPLGAPPHPLTGEARHDREDVTAGPLSGAPRAPLRPGCSAPRAQDLRAGFGRRRRGRGPTARPARCAHHISRSGPCRPQREGPTGHGGPGGWRRTHAPWWCRDVRRTGVRDADSRWCPPPPGWGRRGYARGLPRPGQHTCAWPRWLTASENERAALLNLTGAGGIWVRLTTPPCYRCMGAVVQASKVGVSDLAGRSPLRLIVGMVCVDRGQVADAVGDHRGPCPQWHCAEVVALGDEPV